MPGLRGGPAAAEPDRGWLVRAALLVTVCLFQVVNFVNQPDPQTDSRAHPTLSALIDPLLARAGRAGVPTFGALVRLAMRSRSAQLGLVLTWWWLGWHFLLAL
ncbi:MAG: DUF6186 family protein [Nocardioidaceae bacterium]